MSEIAVHGFFILDIEEKTNGCKIDFDQAELTLFVGRVSNESNGVARQVEMDPRLEIPIFGSNFWDPHWKQNSGSVSDSEGPGRKKFNQIPLLKNREIGIPFPKFGIPKKIKVGI
jgi:hypothetical protein